MNYRHAFTTVRDRKIVLMPEFELTDYPTDRPMGMAEARLAVSNIAADIVFAGFVETVRARRFSSCLVRDGEQLFCVRKYAPHGDEAADLSASHEEPPILQLSIGPTVVLLCADARSFLKHDGFVSRCIRDQVRHAVLVSAWQSSFDWAQAAMKDFAERAGLETALIIDRFHGLQVLPKTVTSAH